MRMQRHVPHRRQRETVNVAHLRQRDQRATRPLSRLNSLPVDPVGGVGVAPHLEVLAQLLVPHRATLREQLLDLAQHERVPLDRRRVMRLLEPDPTPDPFSLNRRGQATQALAQLANLDSQPLINSRSRRPTSARSVRLRHLRIVPNTLDSCAVDAKQNAPNISSQEPSTTASKSSSRRALPAPSGSGRSPPALSRSRRATGPRSRPDPTPPDCVQVAVTPPQRSAGILTDPNTDHAAAVRLASRAARAWDLLD